MATYVNDLRLKEIGTGESSGTWGSETNTNLELIGEALGFGTEAITTNADTHTTTVADGSTDPGRAMYLKYTGTLDSACTITIAPNTISRMQFIENGTSGSQNIIISQGTGANVTIPAGDTKAVYLDGAGSGAAVVDAFASLSTVDLKVQDDLTVTDDASVGGDLLVSGEVQTANIGFTDGDNAITISDGGSTSFAQELTAAAGVKLTGTTPTLTIGDAGAEDTKIVFDGNAQDFYIALDDSADDLLVGLGSTVGTTAIISITEAGAVTLKNVGTGDDNPMSLTLQTSETDIAANDVLGKISFQAPDEGTGTDAILVAAAIQAISEGDFSSSSNATSLAFMTGASEAATTKMTLTSGGLLGVGTASPDAIVEIVDGGAAAPGTALKVLSNQNSAASDGLVFIHSDQALAPFTALNVRQDGTGDILNLLDGTTEVFSVLNGGDTRIGTSTSAYTFAQKLIVGDANDNDGITIQSGTTHQGNVAFNDGGTTAKGRISYQQSTNFFEFLVNNTVRLKINTNGRQAYNGSGTINAHATFVGEVGVSSKALAFEHTVGGGEVGTIVTGSSSTTYNTSSDYRLKENVDYSWDATTRLKQLKPARFNFIADETNTLIDGFLAHEVSSVVPHAIYGEKDAMGEALLYEHGDEIPEGKSVGDVKKAAGPDYQQIDHSKLVPLLVKTIQELEARVTTLEG
jgi:hypothetical protein